jgi:hypothetical protein
MVNTVINANAFSSFENPNSSPKMRKVQSLPKLPKPHATPEELLP